MPAGDRAAARGRRVVRRQRARPRPRPWPARSPATGAGSAPRGRGRAGRAGRGASLCHRRRLRHRGRGPGRRAGRDSAPLRRRATGPAPTPPTTRRLLARAGRPCAGPRRRAAAPLRLRDRFRGRRRHGTARGGARRVAGRHRRGAARRRRVRLRPAVRAERVRASPWPRWPRPTRTAEPPRTGRRGPCSKRLAGGAAAVTETAGAAADVHDHRAQGARRLGLDRLERGAHRLQARRRGALGVDRHHLRGAALGLRPRRLVIALWRCARRPSRPTLRTATVTRRSRTSPASSRRCSSSRPPS